MSKEKRRAHHRGRKPTVQEPVRKHQFPKSDVLIDTGIGYLLEGCRGAYESNFWPAVYEASCICKEHDAAVPVWLRNALPEEFERAFAMKPSNSMGLSKKVKWEIKHYLRWWAVRLFLDEVDRKQDAYEMARAMLGENTVDSEVIGKSYRMIEMCVDGTQNDLQMFVIGRVADRLGINFDFPPI